MADEPFPTLVVEALNLMHPRFAAANGTAYPAAEVESPAALRKDRERSFVREFYHQFRRLWDKALPVKLGLGHVVIQADPEVPAGRHPDLLFWQLGENGSPDRRLAALSVAFATNPLALDADLAALARYRTAPGYPVAVCVVVGRAADALGASADGVTRIFYDTDRRTAVHI